MEISITAVTRNRKFTKALVRHADVLARVKRSAVGIDTSALPFDVLQLVFLDRTEEYMKAVGRKDDRLFQVEAAVPDERKVDFASTSAFATSIAQRLGKATKLCGFPKNIESQLSGAIDEFIKNVNRGSL